MFVILCYTFNALFGRVKDGRENITFKCADCGEETILTRNKKHPQRMEILKYCRICRKKTTHKEKK